MQYIADSSGYLKEVSFGALITCGGTDCTEYTGAVPSGYSSLEAWYLAEADKLYRWKIVSGNLTLDSSAVAPSDRTPLEIVKLWENASPGSSFPEQNFKINGISEYPMVIVFAKESASVPVETMTFARIGLTVRIRQFFNYRQIRNFDYNTSDEVWFSNGMQANYNANLNIHNNAAIPLAIYGIKGVL